MASLISLMTPNASALGPMIPAMEHRFVSVLARVLAIVAGLGFAFFIAYYSSLGLFLIITSYGD